jgi:uncharacterized protein involved in response to NO
MLRCMDILKPSSSPAPEVRGWAPFALGFRPFFTLAALSALILMALWPLVWHGQIGPPSHYDAIAWHSHEMLFGYAAAVIAGFLLTAVRNWTGVDTWTGPRLALLALVWLAGRLLPWVGGIPVGVLVVVDVAFLPLLAISLIHPLWAGQNRVNRVFVPLLCAMALVNLLSHLQLIGVQNPFGDARRVMLDLILLLIVVVAGRVLPFFTRSVLPGFQPVSRSWVEKGSVLLRGLIGLNDLFALLPIVVSAGLWLLFALLQLLRLAGWYEMRVLRMPVLWVLHAGYGWLILGSLLYGLSMLGLFTPSGALHALTIGVVGVFTLGMMARVSLGHTGRSIDVSMPTALSFVLMNLGALVRVFGPAAFPEKYALWVDIPAGLWVLAFGLFSYGYVPLLLRARVDGKPG